jgi:hypothetical protein
MPISCLLQKKIVEKKASQDLVLVMGPSHNIVGMLIFTKKKDLQQKKFMEDFATFAKGFMPIFVMEIQ